LRLHGQGIVNFLVAKTMQVRPVAENWVKTMAYEGKATGDREKNRISLSKLALIFGAITIGVLAIALDRVNEQMKAITQLAVQTRDVTIPDTVRQNELALDAERLNRLADAVLHADETAQRASAMQEVEKTVSNFVSVGNEDLRAQATTVGERIRDAGEAASRADTLAADVDANMSAMDSLLDQVEGALASMGEGSSARLQATLAGSPLLSVGEMQEIRGRCRKFVPS
jgi:hypothetical protein